LEITEFDLENDNFENLLMKAQQYPELREALLEFQFSKNEKGRTKITV
jgi:hypothetical protein